MKSCLSGSSLGGRRASRSSEKGLGKSGSKVSFNDSNDTVVVVEKASGASNASWYTADEIRNFKSTSPKNGGDKSVIRQEFIRSLLKTQSEHREMGINDPKGLRQLSKACSKGSIKEALKRAEEINR